MKTSKLIFILFFGLIILFCLSVLIPAKKDGKRLEQEQKAKISVPAPHFKHIVVQKGCNVELKSVMSDSWEFVSHHTIDSVKFEPEYHLSGDTLVVTSTAYGSSRRVSLWCKAPKTVHVEGRLTFDNEQDSLFVTAKNGHVVIRTQQNASYIKFKGTDANLQCYAKGVKQVDADLYHSKLYLNSHKLDDVKLKMDNVSKATVRSALNMNIEKDRLSKVIMLN